MVFLNRDWDILWDQGLLVGLILVGVAQRPVGRVGQSRLEVLLLFADLSFKTVALLVPNPLVTQELPTALIHQFDVFQYVCFILAAGVLSYSRRTVAVWTLG